MDNWDEVKTAFQVAKIGTVSGAADVLGVHHATVIRHIDALEARLRVKLFQRHARGYTPTEAGQDMMRVAAATEDQFNQLSGRITGQSESVSGEIVITSLMALSEWLMPAMKSFQAIYPDVTLRFLTGDRLFRLEYGEAHVAVRAGVVPQDPDNVIQAFGSRRVGLFGSRDYMERYTANSDDLSEHRFVCFDGTQQRAPFYKWLEASVGPSQIVFRATDASALEQAVIAGIGAGFVDEDTAKAHDLVALMDPLEEWQANMWLVTHVDLHRTPKVQAILAHLKEYAKGNGMI